jgi:hypothetical protein
MYAPDTQKRFERLEIQPFKISIVGLLESKRPEAPNFRPLES